MTHASVEVRSSYSAFLAFFFFLNKPKSLEIMQIFFSFSMVLVVFSVPRRPWDEGIFHHPAAASF